MSEPVRDQPLAAFALRLLLGEQLSTSDFAAVTWGRLTTLATHHGVIARLAERLAPSGVHPPLRFAEAAARERALARSVLDVLELVRVAARRHGIEWLLPKAVGRFPDVGDDLDLLVFAESHGVDRLLLEDVAVEPFARTLSHRLAGSSVYRVRGSALVLDIRHGRLGHAGQHPGYAALLFRNRRTALLGDVLPCATPAPEDTLVLQGVEKMVARRAFHLTDVLQTIATIQGGTVDWDYVVGTARSLGVAGALSCYLHHVDDIHAELLGRPLLASPIRQTLGPRLSRVRARLDHAGFHFPALWVTGRVHAHQLTQALAGGDWAGARRLWLWPLAALGARLRRYALAPGATPAGAGA